MFPFEAPTTISISGTTGSGKTSWFCKVLLNKEELFFKSPPSAILYCYGIWQELFEKMEKDIDNIIFHQGLPSTKQIDDICKNNAHNIIVLDDLMNEVVKNSEIELLFTRGAHHKKLSVIYLNQNMFCQGKNARTIALNCHYLVLFKNLRDCSQIQKLGQQINPGKSRLLSEAYEDCMQERFGYLVVDLSPDALQDFRIRTKIFPKEDTIIYRPKGASSLYNIKILNN